jgi:hypothetical protein
MKFRFLQAAFLLLFIISILAGCSSSPSSTGTKTTSSDLKPWEVGTPVPYTDLSDLALSPAEMPFVAADEKYKILDMSNPVFLRFGATRGYSRYSSNEKTESAASVKLTQMIVEYPSGKSEQAIYAFVNENQDDNTSQSRITWLVDPRIGDRSCALTVTDRAGTAKPIAMVVFIKSNIMESLSLTAKSPDIDALVRTARLAASKIP